MNSGECLHAVTSLARKGNKSERGGWVHNTLFCSRPIELGIQWGVSVY